MKISSLITIYLTFLISFFSISFGQVTLKDDGPDSKSIEESSSTISGGSSNASFTVSSVSPAEGVYGINKKGATITLTFGDDVRLKNNNNSWTTSWTTSLTSEGSCSSSYGSKLVHISHNIFTNCNPTNGSVSGKQLLCL